MERQNRRLNRANLGFSLVELFIVLAVIAILLGVAIPATFLVRASARTVACRSKMRQIGIALLSYETTFQCLPPGRLSNYPKVSDFFKAAVTGKLFSPKSSSPENPWTVLLLPFIGETSLADQIDYDRGAFGYIDLKPPFMIAGLNANYSVAGTRVDSFICPADRNEPYTARPWMTLGSEIFGETEKTGLTVTRGNYAASWGNTDWDQSGSAGNDLATGSTGRFRFPAFDIAGVPRSRIIDGLTHTIIISELLQGERRDIRGLLWLPAPGASLYMSRLKPNGHDDLLQLGPGVDRLFGGACYGKEQWLPCEGLSFEQSHLSYAGARSAHQGGVNALLADGSVRWMADGIDGKVWMALHSISDSDVAE